MDRKVLVTGASGFIGSALSNRLLDINHFTTRSAVRRLNENSTPNSFEIGEINCETDYREALLNVDIVIHTAAVAHVVQTADSTLLTRYKQVNTLGVTNLATQAADAGVKRFIFLSSINVNGDTTSSGKFNAFADERPEDIFSQFKYEAEKALNKIAIDSDMDVVIIRPPLVYGGGVKANFAAMMNLAKKNLPLPLGAIHNKRSLVALDNLVDLIITCIDHPKAANQTFLVSDDHDVSTTELLQTMTRAAGKKPWLLPVPVSWLRLAGKLFGKQNVIDRLCGNLQVDISHTKNTLDWKPPISFEEGIRRCFIKEESL